MSLTLASPSFLPDGDIPARHTCDGQNISPALIWSGVPSDTKSLVLIVDDPDAPDPDEPKITWVHWVLYNLPVGCHGLPEGVQVEDLPAGTLLGLNDWLHSCYAGPCPPIGKHRYFHKLFALNTVFTDLHRPTKAILEKAMHGHVIARSNLIGRYQRG